MIPVLYERNKTTFTDNGLGGLPHALSCMVTEERNTVGGYYLNMEYPVNGLHFDDVQPERIIYASHAPGKSPQPFRISRVTKADNKATIEAKHPSADLQKLVTYGSFPVYTVYGGFDTFKEIATGLGQPVPFYMTSDIDLFTVQRIEFPHPSSFSDVLLGAEGSFLDKIGGEFEWDGWHIILHSRRGSETGLEIRRGANITSMKAETSTDNLVTAVIPYYKTTQDNSDTFVYGSLCRASTYADYNSLYAVPLDVSDQFQMEEGQLPKQEQVTAAGQSFVDSTSASALLTSFSVSFTPSAPTLSGINPAPARHLYLCDSVTVVYPEFGVKAKAKVTKTVYNTLLDRYDSITIGDIQRNAADTVAALVRRTNNQKILW